MLRERLVSDTIFALSSGPPPAAISIVRISGPSAGASLASLAGSLPKPRMASLRYLRDAHGKPLDHALVLWFPGPATATGEDLAELHLHGGRAVVAAVEAALGQHDGVRRAVAGEFTRRAFANGRIDLAEAEGLADLLSAETELQRSHALAMASGSFSAEVNRWRDEILIASAAVEAMLDFSDEGDVDVLPASVKVGLASLADELRAKLDAPRVEALREGFRVVLAGPPNSGKSSLFNRLVGEEAAITAPVPGTTRDILTRPVALAGIPLLMADTAGLRERTDDPIEAIGIERAALEVERADLVLWLGPEGEGVSEASGLRVWEIETFADREPAAIKRHARYRVSSKTGEGVAELQAGLAEAARAAMPKAGTVALNRRQHELLTQAYESIAEAGKQTDPLLIAESLRTARTAFDRLLGRAGTEQMLDALFGRFCIGK